MTTAELVQKGYEFFGAGNIPGLMELYADDVEYHIMGAPYAAYAGTYVGKEALMGFFQKLSEFQDFTKFDVKDMIFDGDRACVLVDMEATVKATGKSYQSLNAHWITIKEGKMASFHDFVDTKKIYDATLA